MSSENDPWLIFPDGMLKRSEIKHVHFIDHTSDRDAKLFGEKFYTLQCGIIAIRFPAWAKSEARGAHNFVRAWLIAGTGDLNISLPVKRRERYGANDAYEVPEGYRLLGGNEAIEAGDYYSYDRAILEVSKLGPIGLSPSSVRLCRGKFTGSGPWFFRKVSND